MAYAGLIVISVIPGLFWLWMFLRRDMYRPTPRRLIALTFLLGCISTIPAVILERVFIDESVLEESLSLSTVATQMLLIVGPVEEVSKFAMVFWVPYRTRFIEQPADGLVYATAAGLGFATVENVGYTLAFGPEVMIGRAPLSTLGHAVLGSIWGYALAQGLQPGRRKLLLAVTGLTVAALVHAAYNISAFAYPLAAVLIVILGAVWAFSRFRWAQLVSPFRLRRNYPQIKCLSCAKLVRVSGQYCRFCGTLVDLKAVDALYCSLCGATNRPDATYCTHCGDLFVLRRR
jgi:RsiW-degrading membrane proteinase PrsW (M82 family)/ribosomal protein L40E